MLIIRSLVYITIYLIMIFPYSYLAEIIVGSIHIYIYEIPLLVLIYLSIVHLFLLSKGKIFNSNYIHLLGLILFCMLLALFIGKTYGYKTVTIIKGLRPYIYYLSGGLILIYGKDLIKFKHVLFLIILGLITQGIWGGYLLLTGPLEETIISGFRYPYRSGFWVPFVLFTIIYFFRYGKEEISVVEKTFYLVTLIPLITFLILAMNRTIWVVLFLMIIIYLLKNITIKRIIKTTIAFTLFFVILLSIFSYYFQGEFIKHYLSDRLYTETIGEKVVESVWENNRDRIFKSAFNAFLEYPILGTGAGYTYSWKVPEIGHQDKLIDKRITNTDTSLLNILVINGIIGFCISIYFVIVVFVELRKFVLYNESKSDTEVLIVKGLYYYFPFLLLASMNIAILFGYPAPVIFSLLFAKVLTHNKDNEAVEYAR